MEIQVIIPLTKAQAEAVEWALDPMADFWCTEAGANERGGMFIYETKQLPHIARDPMAGRYGSLILSPIEDINTDLQYRICEQFKSMARDNRAWSTVRMCEQFKQRLLEHGVFEHPAEERSNMKHCAQQLDGAEDNDERAAILRDCAQ